MYVEVSTFQLLNDGDWAGDGGGGREAEERGRGGASGWPEVRETTESVYIVGGE